MHGYYWGYNGIPRMGGFSCLNYGNSPLAIWLMASLMLLVVVGIVLLITSSRKKHRLLFENSEAVSIIKRRYAKGELTVDEFARMKKDLQ